MKSSNKGLRGLVCCGLMVLLAAALVGLYPVFRQRMLAAREASAEEDAQQEQEMQEAVAEDYADQVYAGALCLYWQLAQREQGQVLSPTELFFPEQGWELSSDAREYLDQQTQLFYGQFQEWISSRGGRYLLMRESTGEKLTNSTEPLEQVAEGEAPAWGDAYYTALRFTEQGIQVEAFSLGEWYLGQSREYLAGCTPQNFLEAIDYADFRSYESLFSLPEDILFVVTFPENPFRVLYYLGEDYEMYHQTIASGLGLGMLIALGVATALALALPLWRRLGVGEGRLGHLSLEVAILGVLLYLGLLDLGSHWVIFVGETLDGTVAAEVAAGLGMAGQEALASRMVLAFHVLMWALILGLWFCLVLSLRRVFTDGLRHYLRHQCWTVRLCCWIKGKLQAGTVRLMQVDWTEPGTGKLLKLLGINAVLLVIFCSAWFFGAFGVLIYSVGLFVLARKFLGRRQRQYGLLLGAAREMAEGNLEARIPEEELGGFESLKQELARIQEEFRRAVEEEARSQQMKTELITNVSHDLKTPLTAIITYIDLLKEGNGTEEERRGYLDTLDQKAGRLKRLIEDLFEVSKAASGNLKVEREPVDLAELVRQAVFEMEDTLSAAELTCRVRVPDHKVTVLLDSGKTFRILENLLGNAAKYSVPETRIFVSLEEMEGQLRLEVKNISRSELPEDLDLLKGRFVRGDKARNTDGSGLGLAIVDSFAKLQGGSFSIQADGDVFKALVLLPKEVPEAPAELPQEAEPPETKWPEDAGNE